MGVKIQTQQILEWVWSTFYWRVSLFLHNRAPSEVTLIIDCFSFFNAECYFLVVSSHNQIFVSVLLKEGRALLFFLNSVLSLETVFSNGCCYYFLDCSYVPCCCQWLKRKKKLPGHLGTSSIQILLPILQYVKFVNRILVV